MSIWPWETDDNAEINNFFIIVRMEEKKTYREVMPGELPCEKPDCDGVMVVDPDNSYKLTCDKCGHIKE